MPQQVLFVLYHSHIYGFDLAGGALLYRWEHLTAPSHPVSDMVFAPSKFLVVVASYESHVSVRTVKPSAHSSCMSR